ncbi:MULTISPECIES: SRPBCC family protein [unclassified Modestobacter]|uniref:SRPBCC family protein n=1 Tax=unclassified Modestobacter TaxID=2643866 RepID=UPI0022AA9489|nr:MULTISPECIES: SRPBCC family protein [unclassified Modestobacter]MCZ2826931.1 SRPBCC family protein [Modestobacter sp. VKM Ac-2981]MCZ2855373.1 SRPBCC family protein [Modestobacter sp. VKM Ac-2982]
MLSYDAGAVSAAPRPDVWTLLLDSASWPTWSTVDELVLDESEGLAPDGRDGVGATRAFRTGKVVTIERITALDPPRLFAYEGVRSALISDYAAVIELDETSSGGTAIRWSGSYNARLGTRWFMRRVMRGVMQRMADGLASYASVP